MVKNIQYFILLLSFACALSGFTYLSLPQAGSTVKTIVIDPGHGGKDPGCMGNIHKEKDVALAVGLKLGKYIEENFKDVKVIYTRTTDVFVELEDRALIANKAKADLFISIHCNAAGKAVIVTDPKTGKKRTKMRKNKKGKWVPVEAINPVPFGTETYVMGLKNEEGKMKVAQRENSAIFYEEDYEKKYGGFDPESEESYIIMSNYTSSYVIQSANLALKIQDEYGRKAGRIDKGVHRQSIWVLWRTSMPSILTEVGYLTNPLEEEFLGSANGQEYLAKALFRGVRKYKDELEGKKKEYNDEFENQVPLENENIKAGNLPNQKKAIETEDEVVNDDSLTKEVPVTVEVPTKTLTAVPTKTTPSATNTNTVGITSNNEKEAQFEEQEQDEPDTNVSAKGIADLYKKETKNPDPGKEPLINDMISPPINAPKQEIYFKVQFASSDAPLNLKQEKFSQLKDVDFYKAGTVLKYTSGKFLSIKEATAHQNSLREKGFKDCFVVAFKNGQRIDMGEARKQTGQQ